MILATKTAVKQSMTDIVKAAFPDENWKEFDDGEYVRSRYSSERLYLP